MMEPKRPDPPGVKGEDLLLLIEACGGDPTLTRHIGFFRYMREIQAQAHPLTTSKRYRRMFVLTRSLRGWLHNRVYNEIPDEWRDTYPGCDDVASWDHLANEACDWLEFDLATRVAIRGAIRDACIGPMLEISLNFFSKNNLISPEGCVYS